MAKRKRKTECTISSYRQPRPTEVRLIEAGPLHVDNSGALLGTNNMKAREVLENIKAVATKAAHGKLNGGEPIQEVDCWMITYCSGEFEIVTLGNALAGVCCHPFDKVKYVAPMKLVW